MLIFPQPHGSYQANGEKIHRRKGTKEAARDQGGEEISSGHRRREEAAQIPSRDGGTERDQEVPEEHRAPDPQAPVPASGPRDRAGFQDGSAFPEQRRRGAPGGGGSVPRRALRGHEPLRDSREEGHDHA